MERFYGFGSGTETSTLEHHTEVKALPFCVIVKEKQGGQGRAGGNTHTYTRPYCMIDWSMGFWAATVTINTPKIKTLLSDRR